jgi:acetate kinase
MSDDILTLNGGSSSLKYALFHGEDVVTHGSVDGIGAGGRLPDHAAAVREVLDRVPPPAAVGHRLVHGGPDHLAPVRVDADLLASLTRAIPFAPLHLPSELRAIEAVRDRFGDLPQVACFDTSFHRTLPEVAKRFAIPAALAEGGIHRYGFHGLSYEYVVETLGAATLKRAVVAHLGNGASMCAVRDGRSVDTTMGFTPTAGLVMGSRCGDLDPGLLVYLVAQRGYDADRLDHLINHESGLLGLSGTTSDMQKLLALRPTDPRAALAIDVFCYQARKWVGALAAALGGVDTVVFTGGIGGRSAVVRRAICEGLAYLGVALDDTRNDANEPVVSRNGATCTVRVIPTDEERMIARHTRRIATLG